MSTKISFFSLLPFFGLLPVRLPILLTGLVIAVDGAVAFVKMFHFEVTFSLILALLLV